MKAAKGDREIVSDYATVTIKTLNEFALAQFNEKGEWTKKYYRTDVPALETKADVELVYTSTLDLKPIVEAWSKKLEKALVDINVEGIEYTFTKVAKYLGADKVTDQQKFITLENGVVAVDKEWLNKGTAAIGRTPVIKAVATVNDLEIATGYIKVDIVKEPSVEVADKEDLVINVDLGDIEYTNISDGVEPTTYVLDWARANAEIYDVLGLTYGTFFEHYDNSGDTFMPEGVKVSAYTQKEVDPTETAFAKIEINNLVKIRENSVIVTFPAKNKKEYPNVVVKFNYNIVHTPTIPALNPDYLIGTNIIQVKGRMEGESLKLISDMNEHFKNYLAGYELPKNHTEFYFRFKKQTPAQTGAEITGKSYEDQVIKLTTPFAVTETSRDYNIEAVVTLVNGKECVFDYVVRFVRPFNETVDAMELKTFIANPDSKDLSKLVVIKDLDGEVIYKAGAFTKYGKDTYNIENAGITFKYAIEADESFGDKLNINKDEKENTADDSIVE